MPSVSRKSENHKEQEHISKDLMILCVEISGGNDKMFNLRYIEYYE